MANLEIKQSSGNIFSSAKNYFTGEKGFLFELTHLFRKRPSKLIIAILAVLLIAAALIVMSVFKLGFFAVKQVKQSTATVQKRDISVTISGSGAITSANTNKISPKVSGTITKVYFKQGDQVKKGDLMFELDDTNASLSVQNTQNSLEQQLLSQQQSVKSMENLNFSAPFDGQVSSIQVKNGDVISKNASVLTLTDTSRLKTVLPFGGSNINDVAAGQDVTVYLPDAMQTVTGKVANVSQGAYSNTNGGRIYNVEITIDNPGSLRDGMKANADIQTSVGAVSSVDSGTLTYINNLVLKTDAGGTVQSVNVFENQVVKKGTLLVNFSNDDLVMTTKTNDLKIQNTQTQLQINQNQLSYYKIYAPADGTIVSQDKTIVAGYEAKQGDVIATMMDIGHMEFTIAVDELDIAKVEAGQKANVTVDALTETAAKPLAGEVSDIAPTGTSSNGVSTYNVTVSITDSNSKLRGGMNANAEIIISQKTDVLALPIEAVQKMGNRSTVWLKGASNQQGTRQQNGTASGTRQQSGTASGNQQNAADSSSQTNQASTQQSQRTANGGSQSGSTANRSRSQNSTSGAMRNQQAYAGAAPVSVQTGINDETYIEITSGLKEGDVVILPQTATKASSSTTNSNTRNVMISGGAPGGGFAGPRD